ncbi:MAG: hypothetical protein Q8W51_01855 [Candidatus Palauibacterales bacterium]|nr:hypothetical protein [Candidatus Palauibacterales bacterium]MDP2528466.1 hypothetical protein [Candidatus Palauibacterales bacterium]MDP2582989.1 hypothetical protein [Candidatus Palauibacterales bacterium]
MLALALQSLTEYVGTTLRSIHFGEVVRSVRDFVFEHPVEAGLVVVGFFVLVRLMTPRR